MGDQTERDRLREKAQDILRGTSASIEALLELAMALRKENLFGYARRLLKRANEQLQRCKADEMPTPDEVLLLGQQFALCTYKDPDLPVYQKLIDAAEILNRADNLQRTENLETLGIGGAISKRMWRVDGNKKNLERALLYYRKGHDLGRENDDGYTGINAAYVLDQLAWIEAQEAAEAGTDPESARMRRDEAQVIRQEVLIRLETLAAKIPDAKSQWWYLVTGGEACFGLGDFNAAWKKWLEPGKGLHDAGEVENWEFETTATQLASIGRLLWEKKGVPFRDTEACEVLNKFLDGRSDAVQTVYSGKFGLGLSGGGFRASFYHIGVLARLAELDLLRHVHVISCVSGGSIVGAHYYLELRQLLQEKHDIPVDPGKPEDAVTREDYLKIVERTAQSFLAGVERNIRTRVVGNFFANLKMAFSTEYSRTVRAGELYERELYSKVKDDGKRCMRELTVLPKDNEGGSFNPKTGNWLRRNKVPMLVLNATTLNTGHNWQFTAKWMGESPFSIDPTVDGNWRYRRMYYSEAPEKHQDLRLGTAVGASACVPGLFEPVTLTELYPEDGSDYPDMTVRLVDGGVHDNQGVASLLEQDCSILLVSDASGQMTSDPVPKGGVLGPLLRMNGVLMERVRQGQFMDLGARKRASLLKGLVVIHLKKGLSVDPVNWKRCKEPLDAPLVRKGELLEYGVLRRIQERIANLRTDLDSFSEVEAHSLMASGYLMCEKYAHEIKDLPQATEAERHPWKFMDVAPALKGRASEEKQKDFERQLEVGSKGAFKIWHLNQPLKILAIVLGIAAVAGFLWTWFSKPGLALLDFKFTVHNLGMFAVWTGAGVALGGTVVKVLKYQDTLRKMLRDLLLSGVFFLVAWVHLLIFDPLFLRRGRTKHITEE